MHTVETGRGAFSDEIIQVMEKIRYMVGSDKDPFHHVLNRVKDKQSRSKSKGKKQVYLELVVTPPARRDQTGGQHI